MGAADMLLHGAISLFLCGVQCQLLLSRAWWQRGIDVAVEQHRGGTRGRGRGREEGREGRTLTPVQRLRHAEPSWLRSGQTTTLFSSDTEKDPVSEARGGIPSCIYPSQGPDDVGNGVDEEGQRMAGAVAGRFNGGHEALGPAVAQLSKL
jgi:hypothetical protein